MKKAIKLLCVTVLSICVFPIIAQEKNNLSEIVLRNTYSDNWYLSIGAGGNLLFAEQDQFAYPLDRLRLGGEFSVGKWFNPNTGLSFNIMGGGLCGFNLLDAPFENGYYTSKGIHSSTHPIGGPIKENKKYKLTKAKDGREGIWQDFNFGVATFDLMGNLTNLFRGRAIENNRFDLVTFAGLGANYAFDNGITNPKFIWMAGKFGLRANFNLNKSFGIYAQGAVYTTDPEFDGYKGTSLLDSYGNLSIGVQYTINKRIPSFEKITIDELNRLNRRVNENREMIENHQDILERQQKLIDKLGSSLSSQTERTVPVVHKESKQLPNYIRFGLDSYQIDKSEYYRIQEIVGFMKNTPDSKLLLVGYADKLTGNSTYNHDLSKKRVEAIKNELRRSGISDNRLFIEWKGDREQPFTTNEWNRVVVVIERK